MILIEITPPLESLLKSLQQRSDVDISLRDEIQSFLSKQYHNENKIQRGISPGLLRRISTYTDIESDSFFDLLKGGKLIFPDKLSALESEKERQKSNSERRKMLQLSQQEREYQKMVQSVSSNPKQGNGPSEIQSTLRFQTAMGANMVLAGGSMFGLVYWASKFYFKKKSHRLTAGVVGAFLIMVVELIIFVIRSNAADKAEKSEKAKGNKFGYAEGVKKDEYHRVSISSDDDEGLEMTGNQS
mmetsp:Transcript_20716/g.30652  ORF Transcript_20716/g.30652 Transcript_20716/m.30652 type:complete len:243 (-) Transcript_20716:91-819(-)